MDASGIDISHFVDIVQKSLEFRTSVMTLLLGAYGFAAGRMWKENTAVPKKKIFWFLPGMAAAGYGLWCLGSEYQELATSISRDEVIKYAEAWLERVHWSDKVCAGSACWLCFVVGLPTK
jgi:hypothetical protein